MMLSQAGDITTSPVAVTAPKAFDMAGVSPRDVDLVSVYDCYTITVLVTLEDNVVTGGFGDAVHEHFQTEGETPPRRLVHWGLPDRFVPHGSRERLMEEIGLSPKQMAERVVRLMEGGS